MITTVNYSESVKLSCREYRLASVLIPELSPITMINTIYEHGQGRFA